MKNKTMRARNSRFFKGCLLAALAALLPVRTAHAGSYTYSTRQRTINAGILLLDDANSGMIDSPSTGNGKNTGANNPDPYVFYILNQRSDIKPLGWNIVNPLAPPNVSGPIRDRWDARTSNTAAGQSFIASADPGDNPPHAYTLNQRITPNMAPYWEVSLSRTGLDDLLQFDVLLLNLSNNHTVQLTVREAEMLRRYVDAGGQLWIENSGGGNIAGTPPGALGQPYGPMFFDLQFDTSGSLGQGILPTATGVPALVRHPIIDTPYVLSQGEINSLGFGINGIQFGINSSANTGLDPTLLGGVVFDSASSKPVIAAGQYGAGQVVVTTTGSSAAINNAVGGLDCGYGPNSGPYTGTNFAAAPVPDLKLLTDILVWDTAHPTEHKNSHQSSQSRSTISPAVTPIWNFAGLLPPSGGGTYPTTTPTPGAAINGNYVYVRTADGVLRAFNAEPGTDILGSGIPDAGALDFVKGYPYDEIWDSSGTPAGSFPGISGPLTLQDANASAPTVATVHANGADRAFVFIENSSGNVQVADAISGAAFALKGSAGAGTYTSPAPAPTVYGGHVYAGQADGRLFVYDFTGGSAKSGAELTIPNGGGQIIASPTVGVIRNNVPAGGYADDIVAAVSTVTGVTTLQLGSRRDPLMNAGGLYTPSAVGSTPISFDVGSTPLPQSFSLTPGTGYPLPIGSPSPAAGPATGFSISPTPPQPGPFYGSYDVDFSGGSVPRRATFSVGSAIGAGTPATFVSAPALGPNGNLYYTVNATSGNGVDSSLVCAHDNKVQADQELMRWRYRLPFATGEQVTSDADGNNDGDLVGFQFVGAPVVDTRGNVFALASRGGQTAILAFNANQAVYVQALNGAQVGQLTGVNINQLTQTIPGGATDEFGSAPQTISTGQLSGATPDGNGNVTINNFANFGPVPYTAYPDLSEPQPVSVTFTVNGTGNNNNGPPPTQTNLSLLHTNLAWYSLPPTVAPVSPSAGITLIGNYLFFGDTAGNVYRFYAYPGDSNLIGGNRKVDPTLKDNNQRLIFTLTAQTPAGAINGIASGGNNVLIVNGTNGVVALGSRYTLVADNNRILETDSEGVASWAVDATSQYAPNGALTHLELNHPSSVFQIAPNDYLVADTGNNRCVRFDRSGNVIWELSRFNDFADPSTAALFNKSVTRLTPGESTVLNHPTSVESYLTYAHDSTGAVTGTIVHYLIADTGNNRVLEVVDAYNAKGQTVGPPHNLVWLSHTYDRQGRRYRYTSASYFAGPPDNAGNVKQYVAALVSNVRIATPLPAATVPATGNLAPASQDAPGSSLVLLDYDPIHALGTAGFGSNGQADGYISNAASTFYAYLQPNKQFDINDAPKQTPPASPNGPPGRQTPPASAVPVQLYLRNPRFLQTYTPPGGTGALQQFLLADDNGVFDLFLNTNASPSHFETQWGFTREDYQMLKTPIDNMATVVANVVVPTPFDRTNIPFLPTSIQRSGTDTVTFNGNSYLMGHYIVADGYSQGTVLPEGPNVPRTLGGEVLELLTGVNANGLFTQETHDLPATNSFTGHTISKPGNAAPISQPAFAIREK